LAFEIDRAARRPDQAGHGLEQRGLAGAVRADQRDDLPLRNSIDTSCSTSILP
jgi:hypothetical protein